MLSPHSYDGFFKLRSCLIGVYIVYFWTSFIFLTNGGHWTQKTFNFSCNFLMNWTFLSFLKEFLWVNIILMKMACVSICCFPDNGENLHQLTCFGVCLASLLPTLAIPLMLSLWIFWISLLIFCLASLPTLAIPLMLSLWILRNSASSFHWLSSSIFNVCRSSFVCPASVTRLWRVGLFDFG